MSTATTDTDTTADNETEESAAEHVGRAPRRIAVRLSTVVTAVAVLVLLAAVCVCAGLYFAARSDLNDRDARSADAKHAERVATEYALGASTIDFNDTKAWFGRLKANTTPQLAAKFDATAPQLEQILLPLQWTSKPTPIASVVMSDSDGVYKVNTFLNVNTTSAQTPQGGVTTVTYSLTIDRNSDWKVTDVGGLSGALPSK